MTGTHEEVVYTGSDRFSIVVSHYGDAKGTKAQFHASDPSKIDPLIDENYAAHTFASGTIAERLQAIRAHLTAAWEGENADNAVSIIDTLRSDAESIAANTKACGDSFAQFQRSWADLKSQAEGLYEGVMGTGLHEDNDGAHRIYGQFNDAMQQSMREMPSRLYYHDPLQPGGRRDDLTPGGAAPGGGAGAGAGTGGFGSGGSGAGAGQFGTGSGHVGNPGTSNPGSGGNVGTGGGYGGAVGPGAYGTGTYGSGGYGSSRSTRAGYGGDASAGQPGAPFPGLGSRSGAGPGAFAPGGAGIGPDDLGSSLASYDPSGVGGGAGYVPGGADGGAPGAGPIGGLGTAGTGAAGIGAGGIDAGAGGAAATGSEFAGVMPSSGAAGAGARGMMMPMHGNNDDDDERDRSTWLSEDADIWSADEAPPGVIA